MEFCVLVAHVFRHDKQLATRWLMGVFFSLVFGRMPWCYYAFCSCLVLSHAFSFAPSFVYLNRLSLSLLFSLPFSLFHSWHFIWTTSCLITNIHIFPPALRSLPKSPLDTWVYPPCVSLTYGPTLEDRKQKRRLWACFWLPCCKVRDVPGHQVTRLIIKG